jgi:ABC-type Zn uptake system ZnuABC Zn-binding protein ZnuA
MQYEMVEAIVGDKHNVEFMFINEQDSLNFKYNQETTNNLENMDLFLYSGNGYEPWVSKQNEDISNGKVGIIDLSRGLRTIDFNSNENSKINPYYWTGLDEYKIAYTILNLQFKIRTQ